MRKLVLFGLLGGVFGLALLLEHFVTKPVAKATGDADHLSMVLGGIDPREVPQEIPPAPPANPVGDAGRRDESRGAAASGRRPEEASAKERTKAASPPPSDHVVAKGETLMIIAKAELGATARWRDLANWNGIDDPSQLKIGTRLRMSAPDDAQQRAATPPKTPPATPSVSARTHRFAKGDTLSHLAALYLGDASRWREIQRLNGIADPAKITEGTTLQLPQR